MSVLADIIVAIHVLWVLTVILLVPAIFAGSKLKWPWVRNFWLRHIHLAMIAIVVAESYLGIPCPLTVWENRARRAAGEDEYSRSFVGEVLHDLIFYDFPEWVFVTAYTLFFVIIVLQYIYIRPSPRRVG